MMVDKKTIIFLVTLGLVLILSFYKVIDQAATIGRLQAYIRSVLKLISLKYI